MSTPVTLSPLGTPVSTARLWTDALVPRAGGGWNWIAQFYNYPNHNPTEWVVMHLETGDYCIYVDVPYKPGDRGRYASAQFGINNQMRAPNGRVFFPAVSAWWWYYDPATETVVDGGRVPGATDTSLYTLKFNHDGSMLYGGTLGNAVSHYLPMVLTIDPVTLTVTPLCRVGSAGHTENAYAYRLRADGDWLYVCVGEDIWDVVAVHVPTKTQTILATSVVKAWADFEQKPEGMTVRLYTNFGTPNQTFNQFWVVDGRSYPYIEGYNPALLPFTPRDTTPYVNPIVNPPQIDESLCPERLRWRPSGSTGAWSQNDFAIAHATPIPIESLLVLPDGKLLGDVEQYQGFFLFEPASGATTNFGAFDGVTEGSSRLVVNGKAYLSGYPNAPLYEYDPTKEWITIGPGTSRNPRLLGHYSDGVSLSGVKRSEFLAYGTVRNRLYMAGLRDRSGNGAGIGYYDFTSKHFAGVNTSLNFFVGDLGIAVFDELGRVVFGGLVGDDPAHPGQTPTIAQLVLYDLDLNEIERQTPDPGLRDTGRLFRTSEPTVVVGLSLSGKRLYRWDIVSRTLLQSVDLTPYGHIGTMSQGPGGTITLVLGSTLSQIDPVTLVITSLGTLADAAVASIVQRGGDLYVSIGPELSVVHVS